MKQRRPEHTLEKARNYICVIRTYVDQITPSDKQYVPETFEQAGEYARFLLKQLLPDWSRINGVYREIIKRDESRSALLLLKTEQVIQMLCDYVEYGSVSPESETQSLASC